MFKELRNILIFLTPFVILAIYVGQSLTSDAAAIAVGGFLGILAAALFALIYAIIRDGRDQRQRNEARRPRHGTSAAERAEAVEAIDAIDAQWRDVSRRQAPPVVEGIWRPVDDQIAAPPRMLPASGKITVTKEITYR